MGVAGVGECCVQATCYRGTFVQKARISTCSVGRRLRGKIQSVPKGKTSSYLKDGRGTLFARGASDLGENMRRKRKCRVCLQNYFTPNQWPGCCSERCLFKRKNLLIKKRAFVDFSKPVPALPKKGTPNKKRIKERIIQIRHDREAVKKRLQEFKKKIDKKNYKSDEWLKDEWRKLGMIPDDLRTPDQFNRVFPPYIPDLVNFWFKYVIECDGSVHDLDDVKIRDDKKDLFFGKIGFHVFRVRHGDMNRLLEIASMVRRIREKKGRPPPCSIPGQIK